MSLLRCVICSTLKVHIQATTGTASSILRCNDVQFRRFTRGYRITHIVRAAILLVFTWWLLCYGKEGRFPMKETLAGTRWLGEDVYSAIACSTDRLARSRRVAKQYTRYSVIFLLQVQNCAARRGAACARCKTSIFDMAVILCENEYVRFVSRCGAAHLQYLSGF